MVYDEQIKSAEKIKKELLSDSNLSRVLETDTSGLAREKASAKAVVLMARSASFQRALPIRLMREKLKRA